MNKTITSLILFSWLILMSSCNSFFMGKDYDYHEGWARVEDVVVGSEYEIISVDGKPATRQKHGEMVTVVPIVVIPEGEHTLTIRPSEVGLNQTKQPGIESEITISVEKNGRYRLMKIDGVPVLVDLKEE